MNGINLFPFPVYPFRREFPNPNRGYQTRSNGWGAGGGVSGGGYGGSSTGFE